MAEHLETILRLVAEGKLSAADAEPLLSALAEPSPNASRANEPGRTRHAGDETTEWQVPPRFDPPSMPAFGPPWLPRLGRPQLPPLPPEPPEPSVNARRQLRIEVVEGGQRVVNLRIPLGLAGVAAALVPGLSPAHADRIRQAIRSGAVGPILEVHGDDGDRVVIATE